MLRLRSQKQAATHAPLFDGFVTSKHTVNGAHKENNTEALLKTKRNEAVDPAQKTYWGQQLRQFNDQITRDRVVMESWQHGALHDPTTATLGQDATDKESHTIPNRGHRRLNPTWASRCSGESYSLQVMIQTFHSTQGKVLQLVVLPPHVKSDTNAALSCRALLMDRLVELNIDVPPIMQWVTDSGPDEVSKLNSAYNALLVVKGIVTRLKHGRGQVAHNHSFLDQIGGILKADAKGNRNREGDPAYSVAEVMANLESNGKRHYPGYKVYTVLLNAAWDFSPILDGLQQFTGNSQHRLMDIYAAPSPPPGKAAARCTMSHNIGSVTPRYVTTDAGGLVPDFDLYVTPADKVVPLLGMARHSEDGIAAATAGKKTLLDVVSDPDKYGAGAPRVVTAETAGACWAALQAGLDADVWVPASPTDEPTGFAKRPWINPGLRRQAANYVALSVAPEDAVVPSAIMPDPPHAGKSKRLLESFVDACDCPVPAIFQCADDDTPGSKPYAALAMIEGVGTGPDGATLYSCRWYKDPPDVDVGKSAEVVQVAASQGEYVGQPEYTLVTADSRLNHGSNQRANSWKGRKAKLNVTPSGMALWRTVVEEVAARAGGCDGTRDARPILDEHASRVQAGKRKRRR